MKVTSQIKKVMVFAMLLAGSSVPVHADEWWYGKYVTDERECSDGDPIATEFSKSKLEFHEYMCKTSQITKIREMNAVLLDLDCRGEGNDWKSRYLIMQLGEGKIAQYTGQLQHIQTWKRCP